MRKRSAIVVMSTVMALGLCAGSMALPVLAQEAAAVENDAEEIGAETASEAEDAEAVTEESSDDLAAEAAGWKVSSEIEEGVLNIRIEHSALEKPDFWWQTSSADKGDASFAEQRKMDESAGASYCGYFGAIEDAGDGEDVIRLVYTNGNYVSEYMEWNVDVKDGMITEVTGGSQAFPSSAEDLAPVLEGVWEEEGGELKMEIHPAEDGSLEFSITGKTADGEEAAYLMHAFFDVEKDVLVYWDAVKDNGDETDGEGFFGFLPTSEDDEFAIGWQDNTFGNNETGAFLKAE